MGGEAQVHESDCGVLVGKLKKGVGNEPWIEEPLRFEGTERPISNLELKPICFGTEVKVGRATDMKGGLRN